MTPNKLSVDVSVGGGLVGEQPKHKTVTAIRIFSFTVLSFPVFESAVHDREDCGQQDHEEHGFDLCVGHRTIFRWATIRQAI